MEAAKADTVKGKPLTCMACKSVLLLNAESLRRHLASKQHMRQTKACQPGVDPVRFAGRPKQSDPGGVARSPNRRKPWFPICQQPCKHTGPCGAEVETHSERGARAAQEAATLQAAAAKPKVPGQARCTTACYCACKWPAHHQGLCLSHWAVLRPVQKRKRHGGGAAGTKRKGTKPGKRQRQLMRGKES